MIPRHLAAFCFVLVGAVQMQACGQGDGQVCQIDGDCASGLLCLCKVGTGARGLCRAPGSTMCSTSPDSGPAVDADVDAFVAPAVDAAIDANRDADVDAFSVDTGALDADVGTDAFAIDAGSDGGTDASSDADVDANVDAP